MQTIIGDLLDVKEGYIFQQVNCVGVAGGLAGAVAKKWPDAYRDYRLYCDNNDSAYLAGKAQFISVGPKLTLVNIFGQIHPGPNTDLALVDSAFASASGYIDMMISLSSDPFPPVQTYFPYLMGCGMGGGDWDSYQFLIDKYFWDGIIVRRQGD